MSSTKAVFNPVEQAPRYKLVARQIVELIEAGELVPGTKMPPDRELVAQLGVSRATIREATIALEIAGFIDNRYGAGAYVAALPPESGAISELSGPGPFELLEARMVLEGEIAAIASQLIDKQDIEALKRCNEKMRNETNKRFWGGNADEEFHRTIARATSNTALSNMVAEFWRQRTRLPMWVRMHSRVGELDEFRMELIVEHEAIVNALESGDAAQSREAMRAHIASFGRSLLNRWNTLEDVQREDTPPPSDRLVKQLR